MRFLSLVSVAACALIGTSNGQSSAIPTACPSVPAALHQYKLAAGWAAVKVAGGLTRPRGIITDSNGRLLIVENSKGITQHVVSASGCITSSRTLLAQANLNHGIYLSPDGLTLYASAATTVWSWSYDPATGNIGTTRRVLVTGMRSGGHITRTLAIPPNNPNLLIVSHGSDGNFDYPSVNPATARAIVKVFDISTAPSAGYNYVTGGYNMGYGLRNEVALAFDGNNKLWGVENSGDNFGRTVNGTVVDIHIDNPAEELNYLGDPAVPNDDWYGYPTCFTVWEPEVITDKEFAVGDQFVVAPNSTFNDESCKSQSVPPRLSFQAHSAPLDSKFDAASQNLYVSLHGSWNRSPPTGYKLVVVPFERTTSGEFEPVAAANSGTGYQDVFFPIDESKCSGSSCVRPVGLTFDSAGRLYMTSDESGELFLLAKA